MHIPEQHHQWLVRVEPRHETMYVSQGRAVLATDRSGIIGRDHPYHGFIVHETRLLSAYGYEVNGKRPLFIAGSNVEQHSWLGYYGFAPPGVHWQKDTGSGAMEPVSEETIEIRVSRLVGLGLHEDIDFTDFTQRASEFVFEIEVDADFADQAETAERQQRGKLKQNWKQVSARAWELACDYHAEHRYSHQGHKGKARLDRGVVLRVENPDSPPSWKNGRIRFTVKLEPRGEWHTCIKLTPIIDGELLPPLYRCREFFGQRNVLDRNRHLFLSRSTKFETAESDRLSATVVEALEQSKRDLAALRLHDLDHGPDAWTMAAGLPIYIALFGRDTLTASWQSAIAGAGMMKGTLPELARRLFREAEELKKRFNEKFWMAGKNFYALGLDSKGKPIRSITSNPGHLLACGIVEEWHALETARRLMAPDLFTGWGIRTLSSDHLAFDPYSYHRGAVWPVEHGSFAIGLMRYGLHAELHTLLRAMFEASTLFPFHRLPECFSGHQRDADHPFPALYPKTNSPQAWSASCIFSFVQSLTGVYPFAPMNLLLLDPHLPDWLPEITLRDLRVGKATTTIRFYRRGKATNFEVQEKRGKLHIIRQPSPWSLTATLGERLKDVLASLAA